MEFKVIFSFVILVLATSVVLGTFDEHNLRTNFINFQIIRIQSGDVTDQILGGFPISINNAPYQISLQYSKHGTHPEHFCGGSIIGNEYVLTASHCVK